MLGDIQEDFECGPLLNALLKINYAELCSLGGIVAIESSDRRRTVEEILKSTDAFLTNVCSDNAKFFSSTSFLAITDGKHPAFFVDCRNYNREKVNLWEMPTLSFDGGQVLYPIGAGDAVAAGSIAAWQAFRARNVSSSSTMNMIHRDLLFQTMETWKNQMIHECEQSDEIATNVEMMVCFAYGLACGSASCLQHENAILDAKDVEKLFTEQIMDSPPLKVLMPAQ